MAYRSELESLRDENLELGRRVAALEEQASARAPRAVSMDKRWERLLGAPTRVEVVAEFRGSLDDERLAGAIDRLESDVGVVGQLRRIGSRADWASPATFEQTRNLVVSLEERDGVVALRIRERMARLGVGVYGLLLFWIIPLVSLWITIVVERIARSPGDAPGLFDVAVASMLVIVAAATARISYQLWMASRSRRLGKLAAGVTTMLSEVTVTRRARVEPPAVMVDKGLSTRSATVDAELDAEMDAAEEERSAVVSGLGHR